MTREDYERQLPITKRVRHVMRAHELTHTSCDDGHVNLLATLMLGTDMSGQIVLPLANFASPFCILASGEWTIKAVLLRGFCGMLGDVMAFEVSLLPEPLSTPAVEALVGREVYSEMSTSWCLVSEIDIMQ